MERIYCDEVCNPRTKEGTELLLKLFFDHKKAQDNLTEDEYKIWTFDAHNYIRETLELPNKVFTIVKSTDNTQAQIVLFPKEPDGNNYETGYDEERKLIYILVD